MSAIERENEAFIYQNGDPDKADKGTFVSPCLL